MCAAYCALSTNFENDHVSVNRPKRNLQLFRRGPSPAFWLAHGIFVTDDERGVHLTAEAHKAVIRKAAKNKADVSARERGGNIGNAFVQKAVVAQVRVGIVRQGREEDDDWLAKCVGSVDRRIERGIVDGALGSLHPVDDASAIGTR